MLDKYWVRYEGIKESVGKMYVDFEDDYFDFECNDKYVGPLPLFLKYPEAPMPINEKIRMWILGRAPEPDYEFINALIKKVGLKEYDAYGFFKYNSGHFITDKFYVDICG